MHARRRVWRHLVTRKIVQPKQAPGNLIALGPWGGAGSQHGELVSSPTAVRVFRVLGVVWRALPFFAFEALDCSMHLFKP